jgi:hypothetical protein
MYAVVQRSDGTLTSTEGFEHKIVSDHRTFHYVGTIDGLVQSDYSVERNIDVQEVTSDLRTCLPRINGRYVGVAVCDGAFEFAASDIGAVEELYYTTTDTELIMSTDFFRLAKAKGQLDYDVSEVLFFVRHGFCRKGSTTFSGVHRLPPGAALHLTATGSTAVEWYVNRSAGATVTYDVFKNALSHSVRSIIRGSPPFKEVVMLSGGVDSSVLLSLVNNVKDVTTATYHFVPALSNWNRPDVPRAERIAKKLHVPQEVVDVDLNEIPLGYLDDVIASMPFAAHISIYFKRMFEALQSRETRLWCGQDLDTLYNYNATMDLQVINRFVLSDAYGRMLNGISGAQRYRPLKKLLDAAFRSIYQSYYKQRFETPNSFDQLIEYLNGLDRVPALLVAGTESHERKGSSKPSKDIAVNEIRSALFDATLQSLPNRYHKIQLQATKLFGTEMVLAYSTPCMVHVFRNLHLTALDVLIPKRFMYRYARELGLSKSDFRSDESRRTRAGSSDWLKVFESTSFGEELNHEADRAADRMGLIIGPSDGSRWQTRVRALWISRIYEKLDQDGVEVKRPTLANARAHV